MRQSIRNYVRYNSIDSVDRFYHVQVLLTTIHCQLHDMPKRPKNGVYNTIGNLGLII
jgi:hypothetical protein